MGDVGSGALCKALGITTKTAHAAIERGDERFAGFTRTPGGATRPTGHLRWHPARASEIVRAFGKVPPPEWEMGKEEVRR